MYQQKKLDLNYFWTATINNWRHLLHPDNYKHIILQSLDHLSKKGKIDVFAFVIMPNHVHLIWRINEMNGKEMPQGSLLKFTSHEFRKLMSGNEFEKLSEYAVSACNKQHEFWQRDPLAVKLYNRDVAYQKLDYIHRNPVAKHWQLAEDYCDYEYSSAGFYEKAETRFSFLKDLRDEF